VFEGRDRESDALKWTASSVDLVFGSNSELRAVAEAGPDTVCLGWLIPFPGSRNPPESTRIRPSSSSVRIQKPFL